MPPPRQPRGSPSLLPRCPPSLPRLHSVTHARSRSLVAILGLRVWSRLHGPLVTSPALDLNPPPPSPRSAQPPTLLGPLGRARAFSSSRARPRARRPASPLPCSPVVPIHPPPRPPRLVSAHHSPADRSRPNSLAYVHNPTSAIPPQTPALLRLSETPPRPVCNQRGLTRYVSLIRCTHDIRCPLPAAPTFANTTTPGASPLGSGGPQPTIPLQLGPPARASSSTNGNVSVGKSALANAASAREAGAVRVREREQQLQRETRSVTLGAGVARVPASTRTHRPSSGPVQGEPHGPNTSAPLLTVSPSIRAHPSTHVPALPPHLLARPAPIACTPSRLPRRALAVAVVLTWHAHAALARLCCSPPARLCTPVPCVLVLVLGHTGVPAPSGPPTLILRYARVLPVSLVPACASDARSAARSGPSPHAVSRSPRHSQLDHRYPPSSLARTASPWRARPRSSSRWPAALRSLYALVLPSSRSGPFARSSLATHLLGSARPRTRLLARTSPCPPARLPPALLTPGADTPCLLARAVDLGPPRLVPAPAVTHRSPVDRSCPNSLAHVHDPTSAISPRTPALWRPSEMPPSPCLQPPTGPDPSISVHNPANSRDPLSSSPRSPSLAPASSSAVASLHPCPRSSPRLPQSSPPRTRLLASSRAASCARPCSPTRLRTPVPGALVAPVLACPACPQHVYPTTHRPARLFRYRPAPLSVPALGCIHPHPLLRPSTRPPALAPFRTPYICARMMASRPPPAFSMPTLTPTTPSTMSPTVLALRVGSHVI
ncbi:hypothetical protein FRC08_007630 [Ceratobasidium sp. 394]|nr:hypothetical protein FRC08_007630 [Ceratobasidium sp. 394]